MFLKFSFTYFHDKLIGLELLYISPRTSSYSWVYSEPVIRTCFFKTKELFTFIRHLKSKAASGQGMG